MKKKESSRRACISHIYPGIIFEASKKTLLFNPRSIAKYLASVSALIREPHRGIRKLVKVRADTSIVLFTIRSACSPHQNLISFFPYFCVELGFTSFDFISLSYASEFQREQISDIKGALGVIISN